MKISSLATLTALILASSSHAALTSISLTAGASSTSLDSNLIIGKTLDDAFAYNPATVPTPAPVQGDANGFSTGFHGGDTTNHFLQYSFAPITTGGASSTFVLDLWGRNASGNAIQEARDNNYTVALYNGDFVTAILSLANQSVTDAPANGNNPSLYFQRTSFTGIADGTTFDRLEIRAANTQYFTVAEVRAAIDTVPEPSAALLGGFGLLALLRRRRG